MKKSIIITGASSGLGKALALEYAKTHSCALFLFGRSKERLEEVAESCRKLGAEVSIFPCNVEDSSLMKEHIQEIDKRHGVDIVISCAGVSAGTLDGPETTSQIEKIFAVNVNGLINTISPVISSMIARKKGDIIIISSIAGMLGMSSSPSYSASKGAGRLFGDALRAYLRRYNVNVSVVLPGFMKTPMTDVNNFPMPFMISPEKAAQKIIRGVARKKGVIVFPLVMYLLMKMLNILPSGLVNYFNSKLPGKPAFDKG